MQMDCAWAVTSLTLTIIFVSDCTGGGAGEAAAERRHPYWSGDAWKD